jgi:hypothetical protein
MWLLYGRQNPRIYPAMRLRSTRLIDYALARQRRDLNIVKRENWTEAELYELPAEELDAFDRKSGRLLDDEDDFRNSLAKALSAFANSGGGSLILGVKDDGTPDGVLPVRGKTAIRDWVEQVVPHGLIAHDRRLMRPQITETLTMGECTSDVWWMVIISGISIGVRLWRSS